MLIFCSFANSPKESYYLQFLICEDNVTARVKLEKESVLSFGELELEDAICTDLRDGSYSSGAEEFS